MCFYKVVENGMNKENFRQISVFSSVSGTFSIFLVIFRLFLVICGFLS